MEMGMGMMAAPEGGALAVLMMVLASSTSTASPSALA